MQDHQARSLSSIPRKEHLPRRRRHHETSRVFYGKNIFHGEGPTFYISWLYSIGSVNAQYLRTLPIQGDDWRLENQPCYELCCTVARFATGLRNLSLEWWHGVEHVFEFSCSLSRKGVEEDMTVCTCSPDQSSDWSKVAEEMGGTGGYLCMLVASALDPEVIGCHDLFMLP